MLIYSVRRILAAVPVLIAASMFVFLLVDISGDPIANFYFQLLQQAQSGEEVNLALVFEEEKRLYLDRAMAERYWLWLTGWSIEGFATHNGDIGLLQGKFGPTIQGPGHDVGAQIMERVPTSVRLLISGVLLGALLGIVFGVVSAVRQYSKTDHILTFFGFLALAMPIFWFAVLVKEVGIQINDLIGTQFFATLHARSAVTEGFSPWDHFIDIVGHLILPTIAVALTGLAVVSRFQRGTMLEVLNSDYVRLARAKGLRNRVVMRKHALRTALIPTFTLLPLGILTALDGAVLTETVFQWRGMGTYLIERLTEFDAYPVMGWLLISGTVVIIGNLVADLSFAVLDPRIRYE